jgi:hypothetical protein
MVSSHEGRFDTLPMKGERYGDGGKTRPPLTTGPISNSELFFDAAILTAKINYQNCCMGADSRPAKWFDLREDTHRH